MSMNVEIEKYRISSQEYIIYNVPEEHRTELVQEEVGHTPQLVLEFHMVRELHIRHRV
jgi:hypothetical protein